jgi:hypothetical protein
MGLTALYERLQSELPLHGAQYKVSIEAATVAVLFYVALTDFLTFKIRNELIVLLLILYALFAFITRSRYRIGCCHIGRTALVLQPRGAAKNSPLREHSSQGLQLPRIGDITIALRTSVFGGKTDIKRTSLNVRF